MPEGSSLARIIALLQADPTVGDLEANATLIATLGDAAATKGANLAVSTELVVSGYPPRDLLLQSEFIDACVKAAENITCSIPLLIGTPLPAKGRNLPGNGVSILTANFRIKTLCTL